MNSNAGFMQDNQNQTNVPKLNRITIIGLGLIGGSLCRAVRRFRPQTHLTGVDFPEVTAAALERHMVDAAFEPEDVPRACEQADLIVIATPIAAARRVLLDLAECAPGSAIITDVCSVKTDIVGMASELFRHGVPVFIGGHPMAGAEKPGLANADPFLFQNALYVLTPGSDTPSEAVQALAGFVADLGAHPVLIDAATHDRIAAAVSHLPQLLAVALMNYVAEKNRDNPLYLKMAAGGFRDMTRIASSPYTIWKDILDSNYGPIQSEMQGFVDYLRAMEQRLQRGELEADFESAARSRLSIPTDTRGFLNPHFDISVEVEDRPGIIAAIATTLADADINIKDIEVLKVRENEGGTLRLAFASQSERQKAMELLRKRGFHCQTR